MADRTVSVKLVADVGGFQSGMTKASAATRGLGGDFDKTQQQADRGFRSISQGAGALTGTLKTAGAALGGLAVVSFLRDSIGAASDLNETLNKSNVIFGDNSAKIEKWSQGAAKNFGLSQQAALDAASGFGNMLTQLGYTGDAATAASTDVVGLAADLGSFNNLETGDVLDRIGAAMRGEYDSLQLLIPNINAARVEQEAMAATGKKNKDELTAQEKAAAVLAIVHKDGAAAANDFAETQDGLANKTKIATAQFKDLTSEIGQAFLPAAQGAMGFVSDAAIPAMRDLFEVTGDLVGIVADLPGPMQAAAFGFVAWSLGGDKVTGSLGSVREKAKGLSDDMALQAALSQQHATSLSDVERALGGLGTGYDTTGQKLTNVQLVMRDWDAGLANSVAQADTSGIALENGFGTKLRSVAGYAGGQALTALKNLGRAIGPELGIAAGVLAVSQIIDGFQLLTGASDDAKAAAEGLADALTLTNEVADRQAIRQAIENTEGLAEALEQAGISSTVAIDGLLGQEDATKRVTTALQDYISLRPGGAHNDEATGALMAKHAYEELATGYGTAAGNARYFADEGSDAAASTASAEDAATTAAPVVDDLATQFEGLAAAADEAKKRADDFKLSLDILTGAHVSMIQLESAFQASLAEATGAMKDLDGSVMDANGNLNLQSEAGRKASDVLLGVRDSGNELIAQMIAQGATTDDVQKKDAELRDSFIKTAHEMGISKDAASLLADQILGIPAERQTTITADTDPAAAKIAALQTQIDNIAKDRVASINFRATLPDLNGSVSGSGRPGAATGGYISGPGSGTSDSIPVNLSNGEFVIKAASVRRIGVDNLHAMNEGRPGFANGGLVSLEALANTSDASNGLSRFADQLGSAVSAVAKQYATPAAGSGAGMTGTWTSIAGIVQAAIPQARINSTYRPGDPGYHGKNKAVDFGFGSGPGGNGSAGLASIARFLYSGYGKTLAELIYDGAGDNTPDVKNSANHVYNAATRAEHHNHVHAAVYHDGTDYVPQTGFAYLEKGEAVIPASRNSREFSGGGGPMQVTLQLDRGAVTDLLDGRVVTVLTGATQRGAYNG